jgi:hypothetical protein
MTLLPDEARLLPLGRSLLMALLARGTSAAGGSGSREVVQSFFYYLFIFGNLVGVITQGQVVQSGDCSH